MKHIQSDDHRPPLQRVRPSDSFVTDKHPKVIHQPPDKEQRLVDLSNIRNSLPIQDLAKKLHIPLTPQHLVALRFALHFQLPLHWEKIEPYIKQVLNLPPQYQDAGLFSIILALSKGLELSEHTLINLAQLLTLTKNGTILRQRDVQNPQEAHQPKDEQEQPKTDTHQRVQLSSAQTKAYFSEASKIHPIIDLLNRFPDHRKQRYIVIPFHVSDTFFNMRGNVRILCIDKPGGIVDVPQLVLEAVTPTRQWYVQALKKESGKLAITLRVYPPPANL